MLIAKAQAQRADLLVQEPSQIVEDLTAADKSMPKDVETESLRLAKEGLLLSDIMASMSLHLP